LFHLEVSLKKLIGQTRNLLKKGPKQELDTKYWYHEHDVPSSAEGRKISKYCEKTAGMIDRNATKKKLLEAF